jgi:spermidine/putrescine transport system permease protein
VFIPVLGEYLTPTLVGGTEGVLISNLIYNFFRGAQIPAGAAPAFLIALFVTVLLIAFRRYLRLEDVVSRG